ncbi:hypothetical protein CATYP_02635 [Corynebacterium atypicum]|uniref:Acyl-CoA carboxylase subunit epsilon n=1 Tax=Corynebacterium atypicum TaxID=191610 RepID=A0ABN4DBK1_9CORY|nr:hypothetical protein [Corynebacterium atypicum]AIG63759.1 hypothetical protein CATYP_02635 [Corynebacterium atypicum]
MAQPKAPEEQRLFKVLAGNPDSDEVQALEQLLRDLQSRSSGPQVRERNRWGALPRRGAWAGSAACDPAAGFNPGAFNTVVYR